ncbi:DEKNAAC105645 [Brettanomyces naardenensis]|uniref:DEKNAAC105645 n=1 Tax=Brettanomyces naardenensis TaxID=13370 RepID=A0A448YU37_BRENA|nr:DEKNAAC105645 [Brettanomyces naardenensis]
MFSTKLSLRSVLRNTLGSIRQSSTQKFPRKLPNTPNRYNAKSSAFNLKPNMPDGLFYQPSPSPLDPEITPKAFLPQSDPRKVSDSYYPEEEQLIKKNVQYMPIIYKARTAKKYGLTKEQVGELQSMRERGATRKQMKEKFQVSDFFISIATERNPDTIAKEKKVLKKQVKRWSAKTRDARKLKEKKKLMWERDL